MAELTSLGAVIKATYESEPDTNAFTDAEKAKLAAIDLENIGAVYDSVAAVEELNILPDITAIRTYGYYSPGDGGGALYKRVESEPTHAGKIQSADGSWWELSTAGRIDIRQFGAKGDDSTDDTASINAAIDYFRSLPYGGGGLPHRSSRPAVLVFSPGIYLVTSINLTDIKNRVTHVIAYGATLRGATADKAVLDCLGSGNLHIWGGYVFGDDTTPPKYGIQIGRFDKDTTAPRVSLYGTVVAGKFTSGGIYNYASEGATFIAVKCENNSDSESAYALIQDGNNADFSPVSDYVTLGTLGPASFNENVFVRCDIRKQFGGAAVYMSRTGRHTHIGEYVASAGTGYVLSCDGAGHKMLDIDTHIESRSLGLQKGFEFRGNATCTIDGFRFKDNHCQAQSAFFAADSGVSIVKLYDAEINSLAYDGTAIFDTPSKYTVHGRIAIRGNVTNLDVAELKGELVVDDISAITVPSGSFTAIDRVSGNTYHYGDLEYRNSELRTSGEFTPEITFEEPGDLSISYTVQQGRYQRIDNLVFIQVAVTFTPTFSTSTGEFRITGLPYAGPQGGRNSHAISLNEHNADFSYPSGTTTLVGEVPGARKYIRFRGLGSGTPAVNFLEASNFTSGSAVSMIMSGFYFTDD